MIMRQTKRNIVRNKYNNHDQRASERGGWLDRLKKRGGISVKRLGSGRKLDSEKGVRGGREERSV